MNPNRASEKGIDDERLKLLSKLNKNGKLTIIKNMFTNLSNLANQLEDTRPDISLILDAIKMGSSSSLKKLEPNVLCGFFKNNLVQLESSTGTMKRITLDDGVVHNDMVPVMIRKTIKGLIITPVNK
jgi:hypothetical protein